MPTPPNPEVVSLPSLPSPRYMIELGTTHLYYDKGLTGSHTAVMELAAAADLPDNLRAPYDNWQFGGHYGEIGKTAVVLDQAKKPSSDQRVEAIHKGAALMTVLGVANTVAGEDHSERSSLSSRAFLDNVRNALLRDIEPDPLLQAPRQEQAAYRFAQTVGRWLNLDPTRRSLTWELFGQWRDSWVAQLQQSRIGDEATAGPNPSKLLRIAQDLGERTTEMTAAVLLGHKGHPALRLLGAIGGAEEHGAFSAVERRIHDHTTALVARSGGERGLQLAESMRAAQVRARYAEAQPLLTEPRHRRAFDTVTWFATTVGAKRRQHEGLAGRRMAVTARHLEIAVRNTDWQK